MIYDIFMDPSSAKIKIMPTPSGTSSVGASAAIPLNPVALSASMQKGLLQNKYEKFRNRKP